MPVFFQNVLTLLPNFNTHPMPLCRVQPQAALKRHSVDQTLDAEF
jgi:hypothetical protein